MASDSKKEKDTVVSESRYFWENYTEEQLMALRFCDLDLSISDSFLAPLIRQIRKELKERNILVKPHFWLSDEWFTPDGIPGIALPFYLVHPRLIELERTQVGYAEGDTKEWCLKLLRHELGHVIDNAFELRRKRNRQILFGKSSSAYPAYYSYMPYSKSFVRNIEEGYAQSHPAEDFAETFAVWLDPESDWQKRYKRWPAIRKLNYMENLMGELKGSLPKLKSRMLIDPIQAIRKTLRRHYTDKRNRWGFLKDDKFFDLGLLNIFSNSEQSADYTPAEMFLCQNRSDVCRETSRMSGYPRYMIEKMIDSAIKRSQELKLRVTQKK